MYNYCTCNSVLVNLDWIQRKNQYWWQMIVFWKDFMAWVRLENSEWLMSFYQISAHWLPKQKNHSCYKYHFLSHQLFIKTALYFITRGGSWSRWWPDTKPVLAILFRTWRTHRKRNTMVTMDTYKRSRWIDSFLHFQWPREGCVECSGPWIRYKWTIRKSFWGCTRQTSDITYS